MLDGLTPPQSQRVEEILLYLLVQTEAEAVFLCDRSGAIWAQSTVKAYEHDDNIAALAAGSFFATRELARLIGEPEFRCVFHEGERKSMYMQDTHTDLLIIVLFGKASNPGLVKLFATESCAHLDEYLADQGQQKALDDSVAGLRIEIDHEKQPFKPS